MCAQVQLADLLVILMSEAEEEEQAERDRRQGLSSVDKVVRSTQSNEPIMHTLSTSISITFHETYPWFKINGNRHHSMQPVSVVQHTITIHTAIGWQLRRH